MNAIDLKRAEFRHYLECSGVMDALSYALIKLYDEFEKPSDPVAFVRKHFKRPNDENEYTVASKRIDELDGAELGAKQEMELNLARQEIAKLRQTLNLMSSNSAGIVNADVQQQEDSNSYQTLFNDSKYENTLIKKHLTEELYKRLLSIENEYSVFDCIAKVDTLQNNPFGVIAMNGACYSKFDDLFDPIIKEIHCIDEITKYPDCDWGDASLFEKFENEAIISIEIGCSRSLAKMPFIPGINEQNLEIVLTTVQNTIQTTRADDEEIEGEFYKISDVKENEPIFNELQLTGIGFRSMNPQQHVLWPTGRGLYVNCARTQSILINEEEHIRFVSKEMNGDFGLVYKNLVELMGKFGKGLDFERNDKYGWLTSNLETLGSGVCCKIRLKCSDPMDCINGICEKNRIKITLVDKTTEDNGNFIELTNRHTFGITEFECVKLFYETIKEIIETLENNRMTNEIVNENANKSDSPAENSDETNNNPNEGDEVNDTQIYESVPVEGDSAQTVAEDNEQRTEDEENAENKQLTETDEDKGEEASNVEHVANPSEPSDANEINTDNLAEGEKSNENDGDTGNNINTSDNENQANPDEPNQSEANASTEETADKPNDVEDQSTNQAEEQTAEG